MAGVVDVCIPVASIWRVEWMSAAQCRVYGGYMVGIWRVYDGYMVDTWCVYAGCMVGVLETNTYFPFQPMLHDYYISVSDV